MKTFVYISAIVMFCLNVTYSADTKERDDYAEATVLAQRRLLRLSVYAHEKGARSMETEFFKQFISSSYNILDTDISRGTGGFRMLVADYKCGPLPDELTNRFNKIGTEQYDLLISTREENGRKISSQLKSSLLSLFEDNLSKASRGYYRVDEAMYTATKMEELQNRYK